jgi:hypothetical protein
MIGYDNWDLIGYCSLSGLRSSGPPLSLLSGSLRLDGFVLARLCQEGLET